MDIFRTRVGDDQLQGREDDNLLICAKLERILSPEAGDHITFSLFLLSSKFFFLRFTGISARLRKLFPMIFLEQMPHVTGGIEQKISMCTLGLRQLLYF